MIKSKSVSKSPSLELETKIKTLQDQNDGLNIELKRIQGDLTKIKAILNHKLDNNRMVLEERLNLSPYDFLIANISSLRKIFYFQKVRLMKKL